LEASAVEDALFGESKIVRMEDGPDDTCFCICGCRTQAAKITNSQVDGAAAATINSPVF
jgi:hypothetical protein